jgi:CHAD domain-containing protein
VKQKPEESIRIFAAGLVLKQLDVLNVEIPRVRIARDIEAVHRMRVSSRRMRAVLDIFQDCLPAKRGPIWQQTIRKLTGALGAARDTDVQIVSVADTIRMLPDPLLKPGLRRLLLRLKQRRAKLQSRLLTRLEDFETSGHVEEMKAAFGEISARNLEVYLYTPELYRRSFNKIHAAYQVFSSYEEKVRDPSNVSDLHAMRIAGKNLRYVMECFATLYSNELKQPLGVMRSAQDLLGAIHDCDVWTMELPGFLDRERERTIAYFGRERNSGRFEPGIRYFLELKTHNREEYYQSFITRWDEWKTEGIWDSLFQVLQVPFFNEKDVMPRSMIDQIRIGGNQ